ncbi:MAG: DNA-formamidopyrimidine glycosylase family protein [Bacteroidota bacterium]
MPEGPSLLILKEKIKALKLEGHTVEAASGNADVDMDRLPGKKVTGIKTWGKHFLICLENLTIRIHLMMFGTYLINESKKTPLKLRLVINDTEINFYTCVVKLIEGDLDLAYDWAADIMADQWDLAAAIKKMKAEDQNLICDALLDQDIFSGVGNIIKNEALYRARVHPISKISDLPTKKLKEIANEARDYSFDFLKWRKAGTLSKHWEVYSKKICPLGHKIEKINVGKNKRSSFVCPVCQKNYS